MNADVVVIEGDEHSFSGYCPDLLSGRYFDQGATPFVLVLHGGIAVSNVVVRSDGRTLTFDTAINAKTYLNGPGIFLGVRNPAPGYGSIQPIQLTVTKSCGTTTC